MNTLIAKDLMVSIAYLWMAPKAYSLEKQASLSRQIIATAGLANNFIKLFES